MGVSPPNKTTVARWKIRLKDHSDALPCFIALGSVFHYSLFAKYHKGTQTGRSPDSYREPYAGFDVFEYLLSIIV